MNPKQDNQTPSKKYFDVARPGKTPANPSSRPVVGGPTVKDFDFADKPADNSISKFGDVQDNSADEDFSPASKPAELQKNHVDLDDESRGSDLSQVQSELGQPGEHKGTAFKPDDYETSLPSNEEAEEPADGEPEFDQNSTEDDYLAEEANDQQDDRQASSSEKEPNRSSKKESKKAEKRQKSAEKNQKADRYASDRSSDQAPAQSVSSISNGQMVVSQHVGRHAALWAELFAVLVILLLLAGILSLLLDAGLIVLEGIPHTDFFSEN